MHQGQQASAYSAGYPQTSYPYPPASQMPSQAMNDTLADLARQHRDADRTFLITLIAGILCLWPILILTYLEYNKKREIQNRVAALGVDVNWWQVTYQTSGKLF